MSTLETRGPIIPRRAPPPPDNVLLKHYAYIPMWAENSNAVFVFVGDPGDGKSWGSLRCGEIIDPDFGIDQVAWDIVEFLQLAMDDSYGQGQPIILEEGSVEASAYDWHSISNEVFRKVLDTWRHKNRMAIINLPSFAALEKGARRRTDAIIEMTEAKPWKEYSQAKFKEVRFNNIDDHFSTPFPILEGKKRKYIRFRPPSEGLRDAYEDKKKEYSGDLNRDLLEKLLDDMDEDEDEKVTPQDVAEDIIDKDAVDEYLSEYNGREYIDSELIELDYDVTVRESKKAKKLVERHLDSD